jgi:hypothetical protein
MAKSAAERRAARQRKQRGRARFRPENAAGHGGRESALRHLLAAGMYSDDDGELDHIATQLGVLDPSVDEDGLVAGLLCALLDGLWERGWQPADVAHVVRRSTSQRVVRLMVAALAAGAIAQGARAKAPEEWVAQLSSLGALGETSPQFVAAWRRAEGLPPRDAWRDVLLLFSGLTGLGELQRLAPPPSRWDARRAARPAAARTTDARMLGRIRALLTKAERTEFPEEAEALTAKAQELMTRHAIDAAALDAERGIGPADQVVARRVHIDNPYPEAKVRLLDSIATANGARAVWLEGVAMVTLVGLPTDLDAVELLFTSLLLQATRAMTAAGRAASGRARSVSFRRAFLVSYAVRIGERLERARSQTMEEATSAHGSSLLPVLRARKQAVDDAFAQLFPDTYGVERRSFDASGWHAGRLAADTADLASGREHLTG